MARVFNGSTNYLERTSSPVTALPITMACWYYHTADTGAGEQMLTIGYSGSNAEWIALQARWDQTNNPAAAFIHNNTNPSNPFALSASFLSTSTWHHLIGVYTDGGTTWDAACYVDGGAGGTSSATKGGFSAANWDRMSVGRIARTTPAYGTGTVAWPCIWNVVLSADERTQLANGAHPLTVRPNAIVEFLPLYENTTGNVVSPITGVTWAATNSPTYADSQLVTLGGAQIVQFTPAVAATNPYGYRPLLLSGVGA